MAPADIQNPYADYTVEQLYAFLGDYELPHEAGSTYGYSNVTYGLLGHVLSLAAGRPYADLVRERILEPLGMRSTWLDMPAEFGARRAAGHDRMGRADRSRRLRRSSGSTGRRGSAPSSSAIPPSRSTTSGST